MQNSGAALPTLDSVHTLNGYPTISCPTGLERLFSTAGPAIGSDTPFTLYAVVQVTSNVGTSYPAFMTLGSPAATTDQAVFLGGRTSQWWAGCQDASLGALGGTVEGTTYHLLASKYDGAGKFTLYVDDVLVAGPTTGTFNAHGTFPVGFGIAPQYSGNTTGFRLAREIYRLAAADSDAVRHQHAAYVRAHYGLTLPNNITTSGDSLTQYVYTSAWVSGPGSGPGYGSQLSAQTGMSGAYGSFAWNNDGHAGITSTGLLTATTAPALCSALSPKRRLVLCIGTNDMNTNASSPGSFPPSLTLSNIASLYATYTAAGYQVVVCTLMPWANSWNAADLNTINNTIRNTYPLVADIGSLAVFQVGLSVNGSGVWVGTYDGTNRVASGTPAQGHWTQAGAGIVAQYVAEGGTGWAGLVNL
ncbi:MAG TPA: GDSL-type esterase/lipase family protein [Anaeromyxobacteraceae bacterium]|nr:GDSL-type esterase/lipase family protein [Anaeromyxobacteraceae bacterium]